MNLTFDQLPPFGGLIQLTRDVHISAEVWKEIELRQISFSTNGFSVFIDGLVSRAPVEGEPLRVVVVHYADRVTSYLPRARREAFELLSELLETADEQCVTRIDVLTPDHAKTVVEADFVNHTYRLSPDEPMPLDEEEP